MSPGGETCRRVVATGAGVALAGEFADGDVTPKRSLVVEADDASLRRRLSRVDRKRLKLMAGDVLLSHLAADAAASEAKLPFVAEAPDERLGVFVGTRLAGRMHERFAGAIASATCEGREADPNRYRKSVDQGVNPIHLVMYLSNRIAMHLAISLQARGCVRTFGGSACAAADALAEAFYAVREGEVDRALVGGVDHGLDPVGRALEWVCGAGDGRRGAAAYLVLESEKSARARGATELGRLLAATSRIGGGACAADLEEAVARDALAAAGVDTPDLLIDLRSGSDELPLGNAQLVGRALRILDDLKTHAQGDRGIGLCTAIDRDFIAGASIWETT